MPGQVNPSRLLLRLESEIANATSQVERDCKRAERAAYLARLGRFEEARAEVGNLQSRYRNAPSAMISSWLHLVLALVVHFSDMGPSSRDALLRAHALSKAAGLIRMRALSAAWVAHMDYLSADFGSMARHVSESLSQAKADDYSVLSRASLVVAQAYHFAGRLELAIPWYDKARKCANAEGDEATLSALMHNMAWLRAQQLRLDGWLRGEVGPDHGYARLGAESVSNFDAILGTQGLSALVPVLRAQIFAACGRYEEALVLYEEHLALAVQEGLGRLQSDLLADQAWCRAKLSQVDQSRRDAIDAEASINENGQFDDIVMAHARLEQVFEILGESERASRHKRLAQSAFDRHKGLQVTVLALLAEFVESLSSL